MSTNASPLTGRIRKGRGALLATLALTAVVSVWGARPAEGNPPQDIAELKTKAQIEELGVRYAAGVDAIGRGDVEEGRQILRTCFTDDVVWESSAPLHDPNTPPDLSFVGVDTFVDSAHDAFVALDVELTQHQIGNVQITLQGNTATMESYLTAFHILDWSSSIELATGVYTDHLVRTPNGWRIDHRSLQGTSYLRLSGSAADLP